MIEAYGAGLSDVEVFTCDRDSTVLTLPVQGNLLDKAFGGKRPDGVWSIQDLKKLESLLIACPCGGSFRHGALARCPNCGAPLSTEGHGHSTFFVVGKLIDGEKDNPFRDEELRKIWIEWQQSWNDGGLKWEKALRRYREVAAEIEPQLDAVMSGREKFNFKQIKVGEHYDREAIFAWTFYYAKNHSVTLENFLPVYDSINKDIPTAREVIWALSRLMRRGWLSNQGKRYIITSQGIAMIENIVSGENDFWKQYRRLEEWCRSHPP